MLRTWFSSPYLENTVCVLLHELLIERRLFCVCSLAKIWISVDECLAETVGNVTSVQGRLKCIHLLINSSIVDSKKGLFCFSNDPL